MERMFQILAVVLVGAAAFFLWRSDTDTAFVTGVLGICAFFLSIRFQLKNRVDAPGTADTDNIDEPDKSTENKHVSP